MDRDSFDHIPAIRCPHCNKIVAQFLCADPARLAVQCRRCRQRVFILVRGGGAQEIALEGEVARAT